MPSAHTAEAMTIGDLLGGRRQFAVPIYQRDYSWTWKEAEQLIADLLSERQAIEDAADDAGNYYLGLIIVMDNAAPRRAMGMLRGTTRPSEVIDGKQRLTTLTMLIAILRDLLGADGEWLQPYLVETGRTKLWPKDTPRLRLEDHEHEFLSKHVLPLGVTLRPSPRDLAHQSVRRMCSVRDHLRSRLQDRPPPLLASLARSLIHRCEVSTIVPQDIAAGFRMFVTVNFRGKGLATNDIIKAELVGAMEPTGKRKACDAWSALRDRLEPTSKEADLGRNIASFDSLLSHVHKLRCKPGTAIFEGIAELAAHAASPLVFINDTLGPLADILLLVKHANHAGSAQSVAINRVLTALNWLPSNDWVPVAMQVLYSHGKSPERVLATLRLLQRLAYAQSILGRGNDVRETRYRRAAAAIADHAGLENDDGPLQLTAEERELLPRFLAGNLYRTKGNYCKAVLAWIAMEDGRSELPTSLNDYSVEHVLPRTPADNGYWRLHFPDPAVRDLAIRSLGNLALVTQAQNRRARNLGFHEKRSICFEPSVVAPFDTTRMIADVAEWTPQAVLARETLLQERAAKAWRLDTSRFRSKLASLLRR